MKFTLFFLFAFNAFAAENFHVTGPGVHYFSETKPVYDIEYRSTGIPQPGCVDQCDMFGCNQGPISNPMCSPSSSMGVPEFRYNAHRDVEVEILSPPAGMQLDEHFAARSELSFKGSQQFGFLKKIVDVTGTERNLQLKLSLQPFALKTIVDSVTLDKHVYIVDGILSYKTLATGPLKSRTLLTLSRSGNVFRNEVNLVFSEEQLSKYRVSKVVSSGVLHTVDLNKMLKEPFPRGTWIMYLKVSLDHAEGDFIVDSATSLKKESSLTYKMKTK